MNGSLRAGFDVEKGIQLAQASLTEGGNKMEQAQFFRVTPMIDGTGAFMACVIVDQGNRHLTVRGKSFATRHEALDRARAACEHMSPGEWREDGWYYETGHA